MRKIFLECFSIEENHDNIAYKLWCFFYSRRNDPKQFLIAWMLLTKVFPGKYYGKAVPRVQTVTVVRHPCYSI